MKLIFGDIVVVDESKIGVVVKCWSGTQPNVDVYVREYNRIQNYLVGQVERYQVRHKYLSDEEMEYQHNAMVEV